MGRFKVQSDIASTILGVLILVMGLGLVAVNYKEITGVTFGLFLMIVGHGFIMNTRIRTLKRSIEELEAEVGK